MLLVFRLPNGMTHIAMDWSEHFYYDPESPSGLRWARNTSRDSKAVGKIAGTFHNKHKKSDKGYWRVYAVDRSHACHRVVWEIHYGSIPEGMQIDHIDRNTSNNSISNLRIVDNRTNTYNQSMRRNNTSGTMGVHQTSNGRGRYYWVASWQSLEGKRCSRMFSIDNLGSDTAFQMAVAAREEELAKLKLAGISIDEKHGG